MGKRLLLILLALVVSGAMIYGRYRETVRAAYMEEYNSAVMELQHRQNICKDQLSALRTEWAENRKTAKGILLFQEINRLMYGNAFPIIQENGFVGTMVISRDAYPGKLGCISVDQMHTLMDAGWSVCAGWNGKGDPERELQLLESIFVDLGLDHPYVISISEGGYRQELDDLLAEEGYLAMILHGDSIADLSSSADTPIRAIPAIYWDEPAALDYLEQVMEKKELAVLTLDFSSDFGNYYSDLFENMCVYLHEKREFMTFPDLQTAVQTSKSDAYYAAMESFLQEEIASYDQQIQNVYEIYRKYGTNLP